MQKIQLPGGKYWEPEVSVKKVLAELKPINDSCESFLGLSDYLTTAIPNLQQMAHSDLVQVKNMKWLNELSHEEQMRVLDLVVKEKQNVAKEYKSEEERRKQIYQNMLQALKQKAQQEGDQLSQEHLITISHELHEVLVNIGTENITAAKRKGKKLTLEDK